MESQSEPVLSDTASKLLNTEYVQQRSQELQAKEREQEERALRARLANEELLAQFEQYYSERLKDHLGKGFSVAIVGFLLGVIIFQPRRSA
jgi:hypothetical protein